MPVAVQTRQNIPAIHMFLHTCNTTHTHVHFCTYIHTCIAGQHHQCGSRNLSWQYQMWQCSMWDNVPLHGCTVPQSHSEIVILLVVAHTCWVPRTDPVPLMGALVHFVHSYVCCTCFLCFPLVQRHHPLSCTVQSVSVFYMWCRLGMPFALELLYMLYPVTFLCVVCSLYFCTSVLYTTSANLPSEWQWLLPAGLWGGPSRDCLWTSYKWQSWQERSCYSEELISTCALVPHLWQHYVALVHFALCWWCDALWIYVLFALVLRNAHVIHSVEQLSPHASALCHV